MNEEMVTLDEINSVWGNSDFGPHMSKIDVIKYGLLKCAGQWYQGHTSKSILKELGLITKNYKLTKRGARCLYISFPLYEISETKIQPLKSVRK